MTNSKNNFNLRQQKLFITTTDFNVNFTSGLYYKSFLIVIYDCNDNGLFYKTTIVANLTIIVANLALARSINYDHKVCCKLKRTFTIINYDPKPFIVQATALPLT